MKSLVLKDLYNIGHNAKSMLVMLLVFAGIFLTTQRIESYIIVSGILCSMMVITTFSFDDSSKWVKYALVTPVTKKDVVKAKFAVLFIFSAIGTISGLVIGVIGGLFLRKVEINNITTVITWLAIALVGFVISVIFGSVSIPLLFKFGAEKARMMSFVSMLLPLGICFGIYQLLLLLGIGFTDTVIVVLLCSSPIIALLWNYIMYRISLAVFVNKDIG